MLGTCPELRQAGLEKSVIKMPLGVLATSWNRNPEATMTRKSRVHWAGAIIAVAALSAPAGAAVIIDPHPSAFTPAGQIHNSGDQSGDGEVFGHTQPGDVDFTLTS